MSDHDREFWMVVRRALLMIVRAIEKRYNLRSGKGDIAFVDVKS